MAFSAALTPVLTIWPVLHQYGRSADHSVRSKPYKRIALIGRQFSPHAIRGFIRSSTSLSAGCTGSTSSRWSRPALFARSYLQGERTPVGMISSQLWLGDIRRRGYGFSQSRNRRWGASSDSEQSRLGSGL